MVIIRSSSWHVLDSRALARQLQYLWIVSMAVASTVWGVLKRLAWCGIPGKKCTV